MQARVGTAEQSACAAVAVLPPKSESMFSEGLVCQCAMQLRWLLLAQMRPLFKTKLQMCNSLFGQFLLHSAGEALYLAQIDLHLEVSVATLFPLAVSNLALLAPGGRRAGEGGLASLRDGALLRAGPQAEWCGFKPRAAQRFPQRQAF